MGAVAGALPVDPLMIQLGQMAVVGLVRVDGAGRGSGGCSFGGICSGVRTNDAVVGAGVLKPKSMVALENGLVDVRAAAAGARAVAVADAGDAAGAGKGVVVGMVGAVGAAGASAGATTAGAVSGTGGVARSLTGAFCPVEPESLIVTVAKFAAAAGVTNAGGEDDGEFGADGGGG
jgi:hypothetical protein